MTITTKRPCCGGQSRFQTIDGVRQNIYSRRCRACETTWDVMRTTLPNRVEGVRIDRFDWIDTKSRDYVRTYGG